MSLDRLLASAAALSAGIGLAHSWLGERYIIVRLLRRPELPRLFGNDVFTRQTIRFAWHLTSVAWGGFAAVLLALSSSRAGETPAPAILLAIAAVFLANAVLAIVFTRARHLSWIVFLAIAVLCLAAAW